MGKKIVISNAFSLSMIKEEEATIRIKKVDTEYVKQLIQNNGSIISIVGHEGTAQVLTQLLGVNINVNRVQYVMGSNDILVIFQLLTRLPEGKILTAQEVQQLISEGKAMFYMVEMLS